MLYITFFDVNLKKVLELIFYNTFVFCPKPLGHLEVNKSLCQIIKRVKMLEKILVQLDSMTSKFILLTL